MKQRSKSDSNFPHDSPRCTGNAQYSNNAALLELLQQFVDENHISSDSNETLYANPKLVRNQQHQKNNRGSHEHLTTSPNYPVHYVDYRKMREVSLAIKDYMNEAESKQGILRLQIDSLSAKLDSANEQLRQNEEEISKEREQHVKDKQLMHVQHQENVKNLECSILDREDQIRVWKKQCERLNGHITAAKKGKDDVITTMETKEAGFAGEKLKLEEYIKNQEKQIESLNSHIEKLREEKGRSRTTESRIVTEVHLREQELHQKCDMIIELKNKIKGLKDELKMTQDVVGTKTKENDQMLEVGKVLQFEFSKVKEMLGQRDMEVNKFQQESLRMHHELNRCLENETCLKRAADAGQEMVVSRQQTIEELKEKNTHLLGFIDELENREKQLEKKLADLSKIQTSSAFSESYIENKILEASSKTESNMKREVASINSKMRRNNETSAQLKIENETLRETLRKLEFDHRKLLVEYQSQEQVLRDDLQEQMKRISMNYQNEKRNVERLNSKLEQSYAIIEEFENRTQHLSRQSSDADNHRLNLEVSNTELRVQLEHQTKNLKNLNAEQKASVEKDKQRKSTIAQLRKKNKEFQETLDHLSNEITRLRQEKESFENDIEQLSGSKSQLETQNKRLSVNLVEMNDFMQRTREQVEQLRTENEQQVEANQQLSLKIESLKVNYSSVCERYELDKEHKEQCQSEIQAKSKNNQRLEQENLKLKRQLQEHVLNLEQIQTENVHNKSKLKEKDHAFTQQKSAYQSKLHECDSLRKQCQEFAVKLEDVQEELLIAKQSSSCALLELEALRNDTRSVYTG